MPAETSTWVAPSAVRGESRPGASPNGTAVRGRRCRGGGSRAGGTAIGYRAITRAWNACRWWAPISMWAACCSKRATRSGLRTLRVSTTTRGRASGLAWGGDPPSVSSAWASWGARLLPVEISGPMARGRPSAGVWRNGIRTRPRRTGSLLRGAWTTSPIASCPTATI